MPAIKFKTKLIEINSRLIAHLPLEASSELPSRGLVMVKGTINGVALQTALEPDGRMSHWFDVDANMSQAIGAGVGDTVELEIEVTKDWTEPNVPADVAKELAADAPAQAQWLDITPMARWEWIRWIQATGNADTRAKHIEVARSKLRAGSRRPCCFNARMCSDFTVGKGGVLLDPALASV